MMAKASFIVGTELQVKRGIGSCAVSCRMVGDCWLGGYGEGRRCFIALLHSRADEEKDSRIICTMQSSAIPT